EKTPRGTITRPPPARLHSAMARAIASVESLPPSPTAPYLVISKSRLGKDGDLIRWRIRGTSVHASAWAPAAKANRARLSAANPAPALRNWRLAIHMGF